MISYIVRRVLYALPIAFAVSIFCFGLVHMAPGDPITALVSPDAGPEVVEQVRRDYGLDRPLPVQYAFWVSRVVQGDFGRSIANGRPVLDRALACDAEHTGAEPGRSDDRFRGRKCVRRACRRIPGKLA